MPKNWFPAAEDAGTPAEGEFPVSGRLLQELLAALDFLKKHPRLIPVLQRFLYCAQDEAEASAGHAPEM